jgi:hypothetical protein
MRHVVRMTVVISGLVLLGSGCATRDWVRGYVAPKELDIDQRIVKVEGKVGEETQRIDQRIDQTEGRVTAGTRSRPPSERSERGPRSLGSARTPP